MCRLALASAADRSLRILIHQIPPVPPLQLGTYAVLKGLDRGRRTGWRIKSSGKRRLRSRNVPEPHNNWLTLTYETDDLGAGDHDRQAAYGLCRLGNRTCNLIHLRWNCRSLMSCVGRDGCQSVRAARTCTSLRPGSWCCVGAAWTRCCKTAGRRCREPAAVKSMIGLNRANRSCGRPCLRTHSNQRRNLKAKANAILPG